MMLEVSREGQTVTIKGPLSQHDHIILTATGPVVEINHEPGGWRRLWGQLGAAIDAAEAEAKAEEQDGEATGNGF